jgi:hypothetical protein
LASLSPLLPPTSPPQAAVSDFRAKVLAPFFADLAGQSKFWGKQVKFDQVKFVASLEKLAATQLTYTINNLPPADSVSVFKVSIKTTKTGQPKVNAPTGIIDESGRGPAGQRGTGSARVPAAPAPQTAGR